MLEKTTKLVPDGTSQSGFWDRAPFLQQSCLTGKLSLMYFDFKFLILFLNNS